MSDITIRTMDASEREHVLSIYEEGIRTGNATFETSAGNWEQWDGSHLKEPRLVAETDNSVVGWAALSPVSGRCVYGGVAEVSVYISADARGKGLGFKLLTKLIEESEVLNIWTLQAGIFPENRASILLHEKAGFRVVGVREKLGKLDGRWRDVVLMERRSQNAGVDRE